MTQAKSDHFLIVGLGNPGIKYARTRHNLGFLVAESFVQASSLSLRQDARFNAYTAKGEISNCTVHVLMPLTFMNLSGASVRNYVDYYKIPLHRLIVIADDVALSYGQLRFRLMGSSGGHNGLRSVQEYLGTSHYMRLRMGVGHPGEKTLADYVLEPFNQVEEGGLKGFTDRAVEVLDRLLIDTPSAVMNLVNRPFP